MEKILVQSNCLWLYICCGDIPFDLTPSAIYLLYKYLYLFKYNQLHDDILLWK